MVRKLAKDIVEYICDFDTCVYEVMDNYNSIEEAIEDIEKQLRVPELRKSIILWLLDTEDTDGIALAYRLNIVLGD